MFKPGVFGRVQRFDLTPDFSAYIGPSDLIFNTLRAASLARQAVNNGEPPSTRRLPRTWVKELLKHLRVWRRALRDHSLVLKNFYLKDGAFDRSELPEKSLPMANVFGFYDDEVWSDRPTTLRQLKFHIMRCESELYRTKVHIIAMRQYSA
jgi:hypothetical protein